MRADDVSSRRVLNFASEWGRGRAGWRDATRRDATRRLPRAGAQALQGANPRRGLRGSKRLAQRPARGQARRPRAGPGQAARGEDDTAAAAAAGGSPRVHGRGRAPRPGRAWGGLAQPSSGQLSAARRHRPSPRPAPSGQRVSQTRHSSQATPHPRAPHPAPPRAALISVRLCTPCPHTPALPPPSSTPPTSSGPSCLRSSFPPHVLLAAMRAEVKQLVDIPLGDGYAGASPRPSRLAPPPR